MFLSEEKFLTYRLLRLTTTTTESAGANINMTESRGETVLISNTANAKQ